MREVLEISCLEYWWGRGDLGSRPQGFQQYARDNSARHI